MMSVSPLSHPHEAHVCGARTAHRTFAPGGGAGGSVLAGLPAGGQWPLALIAPSAHNDLAFTQSMYHALLNLQKKFNFQLSLSENQFVVANAANIMHQYAQEGYDLIIAHGSQYGGTIQQLAPQFPKTSFAWGTAGTTYDQPNVYAPSLAKSITGSPEGALAVMGFSLLVGCLIAFIFVGRIQEFIMVPLVANGMPAFGQYKPGPDGGFAWSAPDEELFRFATAEVRLPGGSRHPGSEPGVGAPGHGVGEPASVAYRPGSSR